mmetsp:Transcript_41683/g.61192  ORF Transcript_41683/g.61192 Transcript_41683/m.61192 type:complete len:407 (-) Transcript_41683:427-1647(-)
MLLSSRKSFSFRLDFHQRRHLTMPTFRRRRHPLFVLFLLFSYICVLSSNNVQAFERSVNDDEGQDKYNKVSLRGRETTNSAYSKEAEGLVPKKEEYPSLSAIFYKAGKSGMGGGIPGAVAGVVQVMTLMWIRTIINYQYRYGASFTQSIRTLMNQGGIRRFYKGVGFALIQAPLARFGSTAANDGIEALLSSLRSTKSWGPGRSTVVASIVVGMWRIFLMPVDTCKTVLQVDSTEGFRNLMRKVRAGKVNVLYQGAMANAVSSIFSHYPWFYVYNVLSKSDFVKGLIKNLLVRNAGIGFVASLISDTLTNVIRVVKTTKQAIASKHTVGYAETVSMILAADGWKGLFGRGLKSRLLANAVQSVVFTVVWRGLAQRWGPKPEGESEGEVNLDSDKDPDDENIINRDD